MNYLVLKEDGKTEALDVVEGKEFDIIMGVFDNGNSYDMYESQRLYSFSADDVSVAVPRDNNTDPEVKAFVSSLKGCGFELIGAWHEHGRSLHQNGVFKENDFLASRGRRNIFGPVVLTAQVSQYEYDPIEVPASTALEVARIIMNANGLPSDFMFCE